VVGTVVGFGRFRHAPVQDRAADDFGDAFAVGSGHHHKAGAAAVNVDNAQDGVAAVSQHQIGRGGVELPQLVQADNVLGGAALGVHVFVLPRVRVGDGGEYLAVVVFPLVNPAF